MRREGSLCALKRVATDLDRLILRSLFASSFATGPDREAVNS
jgi:hypothetical protein